MMTRARRSDQSYSIDRGSEAKRPMRTAPRVRRSAGQHQPPSAPMRRPRHRRLGARGAAALAAACASSPGSALARGAAGAAAAHLAAALNATSAVLADVAAQPPFPSSLYASFSAAAERFPAALAPLQRLVDAAAAPPGPPIFSTVDPTALHYVGPPVDAGAGKQQEAQAATAMPPAAVMNVMEGTTSTSEAAG